MQVTKAFSKLPSPPPAMEASDAHCVYRPITGHLFEHVSTVDTDGTEVDTLAFIVPVIIPIDQVPGWEAAYDPTNQYSPSATDSRIVARAASMG